jgi:hypothetical protein
MADPGALDRHGVVRLTVAICGGALLGGSLAALIGLLAMAYGAEWSPRGLAIWFGVGALCGAVQGGTHVGLHLHREWLERTQPHDPLL